MFLQQDEYLPSMNDSVVTATLLGSADMMGGKTAFSTFSLSHRHFFPRFDLAAKLEFIIDFVLPARVSIPCAVIKLRLILGCSND